MRLLGHTAMLPILIVDDSREDLMLAERVLRSCKVLNPIHSVSSGKECLKFLKDQPGGDGALVFLDLGMVPVSGLEVMRISGETEFGRRSMFVMLSGISDIKMLREGYQLGARTFLVKPLRPDDVVEFLATVKDRIGIDETASGYRLHWLDSEIGRGVERAGNSAIALRG